MSGKLWEREGTTHAKVALGAKVDAVEDEHVKDDLERLDLHRALGVLALARDERERVERHGLCEWAKSSSNGKQ